MFRAVSHLWRLFRTGATLERNGALVAVCDHFGIEGWQRAVLRAISLPFWPFGRKGDPDLPPVARALMAMGPAYVKFGQILSTRADVVGPGLAADLRYLQDKLPPFPIEEARRAIEQELGRPVDEIFEDLGPPVAAASIAQVHPAVRRSDGKKVAVKILRPGIERRFRKDVDAFYFIARVVEVILPFTRRLRPTAVIEHFDGVVRMELDLRLEAAGASEFRANSADDPGFHVPEVAWEGSGRRVMTLEWVDGIPMGQREKLVEAGINLTEVAERIIQLFLSHALRDGYFHADMHQGNLRVAADGTIIALDFGIMGRLDAITRRHYAEILFGFLRRDYRRIAEVHFEAGYVPADRDVEAFAQALRSIGEPIMGQDASKISMGRVLAYLLETTERFGMETRTELILLQRTMVVVEGVARSLDPQANIWSAARPVVETWMRENIGPKAVLRDAVETAKVLMRFGPRLPDLAEQLLIKAEEARYARAVSVKVKNLEWAWLLVGALGGAVLTGLVAWAL